MEILSDDSLDKSLRTLYRTKGVQAKYDSHNHGDTEDTETSRIKPQIFSVLSVSPWFVWC